MESTSSNPRLDFFRSLIGQSTQHSPSPFGRWLHGTLQSVEPNRMVATYAVREEMTNPTGVLHGGAAAAIMDELVGMTVYALGREYAYTSVNLNVDFLSAARLNDVLTATAQIVRAGKNIIHCEATITAADGKIIAKCATNLLQTSVRLPF
ncbi:thioesterase superfamily protein [Fibrisoma limi BUZ 3]|uniref:Thioesterase superfamily protein n=1 Tax=Fibrisoma limi BUZ 3 TaxID=1185876 RepID=I2GLC7_9BACT|nr:PaaI family thioesterase [Fibrisoma limi]CCH54703.1 thioesterase superfamily protein [Fibrisoma limi BUZ 3]